ncbi:thioredoxin [Thiohalobacter sp.]|uniref:thioredoxin n=1 Tax=Thiohalobacter sp. TaxID=2025948 RepID=UPI002633C9B6|nr:thioredoxin [Thiohalobacter sp.]
MPSPSPSGDVSPTLSCKALQADWRRFVATVELTKENFEDVITNNDFVIIDFWADWCGPCKNFAPIFEEVSEKHPDIVFGKINTEKEQELAAHFQIRSIPTLMIFRDRIIIFAQPGMLPANAFEELIGKAKELDMDQVRKDIEAQQQQQG